MTKDFVCGKQVLQLSEAPKVEHQGFIYYFCSSQCLEAFEREPERYVEVAPALGWRRGGKSPCEYQQAVEQESDRYVAEAPRPAWRRGRKSD